MTCDDLAFGLSTVRDSGSTATLDPDLTRALYHHGMIAGSHVDAGGVVLTDRGREWDHLLTYDPHAARVLDGFARNLDNVLLALRPYSMS